MDGWVRLGFCVRDTLSTILSGIAEAQGCQFEILPLDSALIPDPEF